MKALRAIIAEDEPLLRAEVRRALQELWPDLVICAEVGDGLQAVELLDKLAPDLLFLDIQMPGQTGLDVARHASGRAHVVFITAYDSYAVQAFEQGAADYILKPLSIERLRSTVERLKSRMREVPADLSKLAELFKGFVSPESRYIKWLTVPHGEELRVVAVSEILYLRADNKYTTLATLSGTFLLNSSLKDMQTKLDPEAFWQIHRGTVINVGAIDTIYRSFRGALEIRVRGRPELLPVSAAYTHLFKRP